MSESWRPVLERALPGHAVLAAAPCIADLARELDGAGAAGDVDVLVAVLRRRLAAYSAARCGRPWLPGVGSTARRSPSVS